MTNKKLLKMAIEIVSFPSYKMVDLSIAMLIYQRVGNSMIFVLQPDTLSASFHETQQGNESTMNQRKQEII